MSITIKTDHKWKNFRYGHEVPKKVMRNQFDHLDDDQEYDGFIKYKKVWYHLTDFMRIENNEDLKNWGGYSSDSYFSGVVIKLSEDGEQYQIGTYFS